MSANVRMALVLVAAVGASGLSASGQQPVTEASPVTPQAPLLTGLGSLHMPVTTKDARAQAFFDQGLRLLYAFNHAEARRAFQEAARLDAQLAMAHWGEAMTLAVNLNAPMSAESGRLAYESVTARAGAWPKRQPQRSGRSSTRSRRALPRMGPRRGRRSIAPTPTR